VTVATIVRGPITDRLISELAETGLPVGDQSQPDDPFGWQGEPNADDSDFIPWMTIAASTGQAGTGAMGASASEWKLPYSVTYACVSRAQLDWLADKIRTKLVGIERESVGGWRIQQIRCTSIGGSNRIGGSFPDYFTQVDLFEVWTSKERT